MKRQILRILVASLIVAEVWLIAPRHTKPKYKIVTSDLPNGNMLVSVYKQ